MAKNRINLTIDTDLYVLCMDLIERKELSKLVNGFLRNYFALEKNEYDEQLENLQEEREEFSKQLEKINTKITLLQTKNKEKSKDRKKQNKQIYESIKRSGVLEDV